MARKSKGGWSLMLKTVLVLALVTLAHGVAFARLGYTREQADAHYGPAVATGTPAATPALIDGAQELVFEHEKWRVRCALLLATDGNWYVIREEYTKRWNPETVRDEQSLAIQDSECAEVFQMESGQSLWTERTVANDLSSLSPESGAKLNKRVGVPGKLWRGPGGQIARMPAGNSSLILELPQALKHETQLQLIKERSITGANQSTPHSPRLETNAGQNSEVHSPSRSTAQWIPVILVTGVLAAFLSPVIRKLLKKRHSVPSSPHVSVASDLRETSPQLEQQTPMKPRSFRDLAWDEFEILVGEIYRSQGFSVAINNAAGADGGVDLVLTREDERVLVQCKNWNGTKVTAKEIREFFGVLISEWATRGIFVTSSTFTRDAQEFAEGKPLELLDGAKLLALVEEAQKTSVVDLFNVSQWAPLFALSVKLTTPPCPFCRSKMTLRDSSRGKFWGCSTFPRCRGKRDARRYLVAGVT